MGKTGHNTEHVHKKNISPEVFHGKIEIRFPNKTIATIVYRALVPETKNPPTYRSKIILYVDNCSLKIDILSKDLISLRASLNSYLMWISAIIGGLEAIKNELRGFKESSKPTAADIGSRGASKTL